MPLDDLLKFFERGRAAQEAVDQQLAEALFKDCTCDGENVCSACQRQIDLAAAQLREPAFPKLVPLADSRDTECPFTHAGKHIPGESYKVCWYCQL